jgi:hypothetical protein
MKPLAINTILANKYQVKIGIIIFLIGSLVYFTDRLPLNEVWLTQRLNLYNFDFQIFGKLGYYLPSFVHVLSFTLITAGIIAEKNKSYFILSLLWCLIGLIFELIQSDYFVENLLQFTHNNSRMSGINKWLITYSLRGTFDLIDVIAIFSGSICAYYLLILTKSFRRNNNV